MSYSSSEFVRKGVVDILLKQVVAGDPAGWGWHVLRVDASDEVSTLVLKTYNPIRGFTGEPGNRVPEYTHEVTINVTARRIMGVPPTESFRRL